MLARDFDDSEVFIAFKESAVRERRFFYSRKWLWQRRCIDEPHDRAIAGVPAERFHRGDVMDETEPFGMFHMIDDCFARKISPGQNSVAVVSFQFDQFGSLPPIGHGP